MTTCTDCSEEYNQDDFKTCPRCYCAKTGKYGAENAKKFYCSKMKEIEKVDQEIEEAKEGVREFERKKRKICEEIKKGIENRTSVIWEAKGSFPRSSSYQLQRYFTEEEAKEAAAKMGSDWSRQHGYSTKVNRVAVTDFADSSLLVMEQEDGYTSP